MPRPVTASKASISLEFDSKWIVISEIHWQTDNHEEEKERVKKMRKEKEEKKEIPVIKEKEEIEEKEEEEKVIRVKSEIEYRRDMPNSKSEEVPVREVVGKKKKKEEKEAEKHDKEKEREVDTDSLVQVCI